MRSGLVLLSTGTVLRLYPRRPLRAVRATPYATADNTYEQACLIPGRGCRHGIVLRQAGMDHHQLRYDWVGICFPDAPAGGSTTSASYMNGLVQPDPQCLPVLPIRIYIQETLPADAWVPIKF